MSKTESEGKAFDYVVIGAGIVGAATAYKLSLKYPDKKIALVEKEIQPGCHQTGRNSGVIHSGIYYQPGSLKAKNCLNGRNQLVEFAETNGVDYDICGKLIVATIDEEVELLNQIFKKGVINGTPGIVLVDQAQIKEKEPYIEGIKAIWVPSAGIIDFVGVVLKCIALFKKTNKGNRLILGQEVDSFDRLEGRIIVKTRKMTLSAKRVVVCAGLQSDRLALLDGLKLDMQIVGFRGDYYQLLDHAKHKIKHLVYPVPDPKYPFLGVHYTPMVNGDIECGPNAVFSFKREGYQKTSFSFKDSLQALSFKGTYALFAKNWQKGLEEYRRAFSKRLFVRELQKMMPSIRSDEVISTRSGVRAQAVGLGGELIDDFKIIMNQGVTHVVNAPSPAATACFAIADEIVSGIEMI